MIHVLVHFSRIVAGAATAEEIFPLLVDAALQHIRADGAAVLRIGEGDLARVVAARHLPEGVSDWQIEADTIGPELGHSLLRACDGRFSVAHSLPLVAGGDLFGVLVLLSVAPRALSAEQLELTEALADLTAIAMSKAVQYQKLERSYAELRSSQETLARTETLRALGQMAGGVSHDLMNILNPLSLQLQLLRRRIDKGRDAALETLDRMEEVVKLGTETVQRLRDFSRQAPERKAAPTDLNQTIVTALELSRARLRQHTGVELHERLGHPPPVLSVAADLMTAIVNFVLNATEAMPEGGNITVSSGADEGGGWVSVADDGPGMSPEVERRVFEPFFTTKKEGTGLGLAIVDAFVRRQGGKLTLTTAPGQGTCFRLWFPAA